MNIVLTMLASLVLAGIIISPFFWLKFLKKKSVVKYLVASSISVVVIFGWYLFFGNRFLTDLTANVDAGLYYFYYDVGFNATMIVHFLIVISPFIFSKILFGGINIKQFLKSLLLSVIISVIYVYLFVYVLLPKAFGELLKHL